MLRVFDPDQNIDHITMIKSDLCHEIIFYDNDRVTPKLSYLNDQTFDEITKNSNEHINFTLFNYKNNIDIYVIEDQDILF